MRQKDVRNTTGVVKPFHELRRIARRVDQQIAVRTRCKIRMCAKRRPRVESAAPHPRCDLLRKDRGVRTRLFRFAAYRCCRTYEHRTPGSKLLFRRVGLPGEDTLVVSFDNQPGRDVTRCTTIDARRVDVPLPWDGVGIACGLHLMLQVRSGSCAAGVSVNIALTK